MDYKETLDFLFNSLPVFQNIGGAAYKANLNNSHALDEYLGFPHRKFITIHVAGTNGKGSVSHMLASVLQKAGYKTGLYTSPHLYDFRERIRVNGEMIPENEVTDFVRRHKAKIEEIKPSFFEMTVFMAFDYFARAGVEIAVIEVGMGGRLDSTNVITPILSIITNISFDHTQFLGDSLAAIAGEKAGIIKPGITVVIGESDPETSPVFTVKARQTDSTILFADTIYKCLGSRKTQYGQELTIKKIADNAEFTIETDLAGNYQKKNILTVLTSLDVLKDKIKISSQDTEEGIRYAAATTGLYGRWQKVSESPLVIYDTAHNTAGLRETMAQIAEQKYHNLYMVFGVVNDKHLDGILPLLPQEAYYFFTQANIARAMDAGILAEKASLAGLKGEIIRDVGKAVRTAVKKASPDDMVYVGGSNFVVAEAALKK